MRFLLFFITFSFAGIFYTFLKFSQGKDIFGGNILHNPKIQSLSGNLMIETLFFLILAIFFIFYFSPVLKKGNISLRENKYSFYIIFYVVFILSYFSTFFTTGSFIFSVFIFFAFGDICFNFLSKMEYFSQQKMGLRYFGLALNYISSFLALYYISENGFSFFMFLILIFSAIFNYFVHEKYTNYISLGMSIIIIVFLLYFSILEVYSLVQNILFLS